MCTEFCGSSCPPSLFASSVVVLDVEEEDEERSRGLLVQKLEPSKSCNVSSTESKTLPKTALVAVRDRRSLAKPVEGGSSDDAAAIAASSQPILEHKSVVTPLNWRCHRRIADERGQMRGRFAKW